MRSFTFAALVCALLIGLPSPAAAQSLYTVSIANNQLSAVRLYVWVGRVRMPLGRLGPGEVGCFTLSRAPGQLVLEAQALGTSHFSAPLTLSGQRSAWDWVVHDSQPLTELSMQPREFSCR